MWLCDRCSHKTLHRPHRGQASGRLADARYAAQSGLYVVSCPLLVARAFLGHFCRPSLVSASASVRGSSNSFEAGSSEGVRSSDRVSNSLEDTPLDDIFESVRDGDATRADVAEIARVRTVPAFGGCAKSGPKSVPNRTRARHLTGCRTSSRSRSRCRSRATARCTVRSSIAPASAWYMPQLTATWGRARSCEQGVATMPRLLPCHGVPRSRS